MKKVIILGGSFDPIHKGHISILKEAMNELDINEGWLMIARNPRWKSDYSSISMRLKLLSLVVKNEKNIKICKEELNDKSTNYTYNTMLRLKEKYNNIEFYFLIGGDQLNLLNKWYEIDKLSRIVNFVVVNRPNYELNNENIKKYNCKVINYNGPDISSTDFKNTLNLNLIPEYLHDYIIKTGDYYKRKLRKLVNYRRYCHSLQVAKLAKEIAMNNSYDENKAFLAGLLHDCAKDVKKSIEDEIMLKLFSKHISEKRLVYHQYVGSILVEKEFNIKDIDIIDAIRCHTTGEVNMSTLSKILYCADKIEPTRGFDSSYMINECLNDIEKGFLLVLKENYIFLVKEKGLNLKDSSATKECLEYYKIV